MTEQNTYKCYWAHDPDKWQIIHAATAWDARKAHRDDYNIRNKADVPVHECIAIRQWG
ncbi:hypothetical protein [Bradyrhizobium retamae]|uniref:hypothetical protein n=1 Tax=Bradyrhizobium retamae TaxID=1300035 RepID=UPI000AD0011D|nr:hypothetical protein [Bradyrhizobium retamae]